MHVKERIDLLINNAWFGEIENSNRPKKGDYDKINDKNKKTLRERSLLLNPPF